MLSSKLALLAIYFCIQCWIFLRAKAAVLSARLSYCNSVCLSVRLSHGWIRQKRSKLGSPNFHHWLPGRL